MKQFIQNQLNKINPIDFSIYLTVFFIIIHFQQKLGENPLLLIPIVFFSTLGLLFEECRKSGPYWIIQTSLYFIWVFLNWQVIDNHLFLWGYLLLGITTASFSSDRSTSFELTSRLLIGFCFIYAVFHKLTPNFVSGDFFYYKLITDERFNFIGNLIQFNTSELISENKLLINKLMSNSTSVILNAGPSILHLVSSILTWYTLIIESLLAIIFFLPKKKFYEWQHWLLLLFSSIYFILPIKGFAYTLLTLGFANLKKDDNRLKLIYIIFILYIFLFSSTMVDIINAKTTYLQF